MSHHPFHPQRGSKQPRRAHDAPTPDAETVTFGAGYVLPGGRVDGDAIRIASEQAAEQGIEDDTELRRVVFQLSHDLNKRLDKYLTDRITFMSRTQLQRLIEEGGVLVNKRLGKSSTILHAGDVVEVVVPPPPSTEIQPQEIPLDVMYEDEAIIVINKAADILVHPARSHLNGTMVNALAWYVRNKSQSKGELSGVGKEFARPGVVHRLDRHTSGCIVFAKQDEAHWKLGHQFEHRRVDKRYLAVVQGRVEPSVQVIDMPIGPHPSREKGYREKMVVRHDELGRPSVTICRVRERYELPRVSEKSPRLQYSLVELELKTGRTHQIRVHLSTNEWPIVGDDMYGGSAFEDEHGKVLLSRQALHACTLGITHPITEQPMQFTAPLRGELATLVDSLRHRSEDRLRVIDAPGATIDLEKVLPMDDALKARLQTISQRSEG